MNHGAAHVVARANDDAFDDADDDASDDDSTDADDPSDWMSSSRSRSRVVLDDADGSSRVIIHDDIDDAIDDARPPRAAMRAKTRVVIFSTRRDVRGRV